MPKTKQIKAVKGWALVTTTLEQNTIVGASLDKSLLEDVSMESRFGRFWKIIPVKITPINPKKKGK